MYINIVFFIRLIYNIRNIKINQDEVVGAVLERLVSELSLLFKVQPHITPLKLQYSTCFSMQRPCSSKKSCKK